MAKAKAAVSANKVRARKRTATVAGQANMGKALRAVSLDKVTIEERAHLIVAFVRIGHWGALEVAEELLAVAGQK